MSKPLVSIIIPIYNRGHLLIDTLKSVLDQSYTNWECIIVDDGSNMETVKQIESYIHYNDNIKYYKRERLPKGVSTSRNIGIEKVNGEYVIFLDSDDLLHKNCLENRIIYALQNPGYDFWVFTMKEFIDNVEDGCPIHNKYPEMDSSEEYLKLFVKGSVAFHLTSPLWKGESLIKIKGFNEKLRLWEDPELHIRAILTGLSFKVNRNSEPDCYYRNDRERKKELLNNSEYLNKWYTNTKRYFGLISKELLKERLEKRTYKNLLLFNIINFIKKFIIEKKNSKQFIRYYFLLIRHGLLNFKQGVILISWFLFMVLKIKKMGRWSVNSLRKRMYYLISNS